MNKSVYFKCICQGGYDGQEVVLTSHNSKVRVLDLKCFFFSMSLWVSSGNSVFVLPPKNISPCVCDCFQKEWGFVHRFSHVFQAI